MNIGKYVKARRKELNLTQAELAARCGYTGEATISRIENGSRGVPLLQIEKLAEALECSVEYLFGAESAVECDFQCRLGNGDIVYVRTEKSYSDGDCVLYMGSVWTLYNQDGMYVLIGTDGKPYTMTAKVDGKIIARLTHYE